MHIITYRKYNKLLIPFLFSINRLIISSLSNNCKFNSTILSCGISISFLLSTSTLSVAIEHNHIWYVLLTVL